MEFVEINFLFFTLANFHFNKIENANYTSITQAFVELLIIFWTEKFSYPAIEKLRACVSNKVPAFNNFNQQDAFEFFEYFIENLHSELVTLDPIRGENSIIMQLFLSEIEQTLECYFCHNVS